MASLPTTFRTFEPEVAAAVAGLAGVLVWQLGRRSPLLALLRWWLVALSGVAFAAALSWATLSRFRPPYLADRDDWMPAAASLVIAGCLVVALWCARPPWAPLRQAIRRAALLPAVRRLAVGVPSIALAAGTVLLLSAAALAPPPAPATGADTLWIGTAGGLSRLGPGGWQAPPPGPPSGGDSRVAAAVVDHQGYLWLGTGQGVARYDGRDWTWLDRTNSVLPGGNILALAVDHDGVVWVGGEFGIAAFPPHGRARAFRMWTSPLLHNVVDAIYVDSHNRKWFGSAGGVNVYAGSCCEAEPAAVGATSLLASETPWRQGAWVQGFNSSTSRLPADLVFAIAEDAQGRMWFGTVDGAAVLDADGKTWTRFWTTNSPLPHDKVHAIVVDPQGRVWFGTENGAAMLDGDRWTVYLPEPGGLAHPWVQTLAVDGRGRIWAGTRGGGLSVFDGQRWHTTRTSRLHRLAGWLVRSYRQRTLAADDILALAWAP